MLYLLDEMSGRACAGLLLTIESSLHKHHNMLAWLCKVLCFCRPWLPPIMASHWPGYRIAESVVTRRSEDSPFRMQCNTAECHFKPRKALWVNEIAELHTQATGWAKTCSNTDILLECRQSILRAAYLWRCGWIASSLWLPPQTTFRFINSFTNSFTTAFT